MPEGSTKLQETKRIDGMRDLKRLVIVEETFLPYLSSNRVHPIHTIT